MFPYREQSIILLALMRIIAVHTIKKFWTKHPQTEQPLKSWVEEVQKAEWSNPQELKAHFRSASIITGKRVVFNIKGNCFRMIVHVEYRLKIVFMVWIGSHKEYDLIDVKSIRYDRSD